MTYILKTGNAGLDRLKIVNKMYNPESEIFLKYSQIKKGSVIIDAGCGIGIMSSKLAKFVGSKGKIIAIDQSKEQIDIAKNIATNTGISNIEFIHDDIMNLDKYNFNIDAIYSRLVLAHQVNPIATIEKYLDSLNSGGLLLCEEPITSSSFCIPDSPAFKEHLSLYIAMGKEHGFDFDLGQHLLHYFSQANIQILLLRKSQNSFHDPSIKKIAYSRTMECSDRYLEQLVSNEHLKLVLNRLDELANNNECIVSGVNMVQILGKKK